MGYAFTFPDTSNTRYQSYCFAAIELTTNLELYIHFLGKLHLRKSTKVLTNMEQNVLDGLQDEPTITEICVLALYGLSTSIPYTRLTRGSAPTTNILDLGPLHLQVAEHCQLLSDHPELILSPVSVRKRNKELGKLG